MKKHSKLSCSKMIKATAILLACIALITGFYLLIDGFHDYISDAKYGWGTEAEEAQMMTGLIYMLSGWVGGLTLYGFGIIVKAHEAKCVVNQNNV